MIGLCDDQVSWITSVQCWEKNHLFGLHLLLLVQDVIAKACIKA